MAAKISTAIAFQQDWNSSDIEVMLGLLMSTQTTAISDRTEFKM
jgi:hypothetical protein